MKIQESAGAGKAAKVNIVAQEIRFAKLLAGNDHNVSFKEKQLKKLKIWLKNRASASFSFTNEDCLRLWKGLYYSMWMSDKPLPQESLANQLASLIHCFEKPKISVQFFGMFLKTMCNEWITIDQWRIDKFMMLVRRVTREMLVELQSNDWDANLLTEFAAQLKDTVLNSAAPRGLFMHFTEIYLEEVAKVSDGTVDTATVTRIVDPYIHYLATQPDYKLVRHVLRHIFNHLLYQSEMGRKYREKFDAWKAMGFPGNSINDIALEEIEDEEDAENGIDSADESESEENADGEAAEDSDESDDEGEVNGDGETSEDGEKPLDPRAGRVNVVMPIIEFDAAEIVSILEGIKYKKFTRVKNRKTIDRVVDTFKTFAAGTFPIGFRKLGISRDDIQLPSVEEKAEEILQFEEELYGAQRQLKTLTKRKRKRVVADKTALDELQTKVRKIAKLKNDSNSWIEEEQPQNVSLYSDVEDTADNDGVQAPITNGKLDEVDAKQSNNTDISVRKLKKKKARNIVADNELNGTVENNEPNAIVNTPETNKTLSVSKQKNKTPKKSPKSPKLNNDEWAEPLKEGEVEYVIPAKKFKGNTSITRIEGKAINGDSTPTATPIKLKSAAQASTPLLTPVHVQSVLSTSLTLSRKKNVKIMLKMNQSQEAVEYIRQLKQSPCLPFDSKQKPLKGVLKPNLLPSPINPYYKKLIGMK